MAKVAIVTDSCASIPEPVIKELDIHWVAYYIHRGQEVLRDLVTIQLDEFLRWLPTAKELPTTASPGPGDYLSMYEELAKERSASEIVSIHMTSKGSGAYQAAKAAQSMAQEQLPDVRIEVIDTRNVSMCHGWMVIEAARAALAGASLEQIVARSRSMIPVTRMIQTADTSELSVHGRTHRQGQAPAGNAPEHQTAHRYGRRRDRPPGPGAQPEPGLPDDGGYGRGRRGPMGKIKIAYVHAGALDEIEKLKAMVEAR